MSSNIDYQIYRKEITNFLSTVSIKFSMFADKMKENVLYTLGKEIEDTENPYYLNLLGEYSSLDEPMYVTNEDGTKVLFSKDLAKTHSKLFGNYGVTTEEYTNLCSTYPSQVGLIKNIIYPSELTIEELITTNDLTIVSADYSYLHINEQESIRIAIEKALDKINTRWMMYDYVYEETYPIVFMSNVYYILFATILIQRIKNIKTEYVHPLHVWEYLDGKGLSEFKSVLSTTQVSFLYRNIDYILNNRGKKSNLEILADNILSELYIELVGKTIYQDNEMLADNVITYPEFINEDVVITNITVDDSTDTEIEDMNAIFYRLKENDYHPDYDVDYIAEKEYTFSRTEFNKLRTRLLDFKKKKLSTKYLSLLVKYLLDTLHYQITLGNINYDVEYLDDVLGLNVKLDVRDAILLFTYAHYKYLNEKITTTTKYHNCHYCYLNERPEVTDYFRFRQYEYKFNTFIDVEGTLDNIGFSNSSMKSVSEFMTLCSNQFLAMLYDIWSTTESAFMPYQYGMNELYKQVQVRGQIEVPLTSYNTFNEWINSNETISSIIEAYDAESSSREQYSVLRDKITTALFPVNDTILTFFVGDEYAGTSFYSKLKELFIKLCSYRLTFLETERDSNIYITIPTSGFYCDKISYTVNIDMDVISDDALEIEGIKDYSISDEITTETNCEVTGGSDSISVTSTEHGSICNEEPTKVYVPIQLPRYIPNYGNGGGDIIISTNVQVGLGCSMN